MLMVTGGDHGGYPITKRMVTVTGLRLVKKEEEEEEEEEVELSLGLSIGGKYKRKAGDFLSGSETRNADPKPSVVPMVTRYGPVVNGFGFGLGPLVGAGSGRSRLNPMACRCLPLPALRKLNGYCDGNANPNLGKFDGKSGDVMKREPSISESVVRSFSGISDYRSGAIRGRSKSGINQIRSFPNPTAVNSPKPQAPPLTHDAVWKPTIPAPASAITSSLSNEEASLDKNKMPFVTTMGTDGKWTSGFLYKYTMSEITIVCVCHGSSFSPQGFVRHAGGVESSHPLRQIVVVPS